MIEKIIEGKIKNYSPVGGILRLIESNHKNDDELIQKEAEKNSLTDLGATHYFPINYTKIPTGFMVTIMYYKPIDK